MHIILETYKNKAQVQTAKTHVQFPFVQTKCYEKKVDERARRSIVFIFSITQSVFKYGAKKCTVTGYNY